MRTATLSTQVRGTHHLVRLILRRDRVRLPLWILGITAITAVSAPSVLSFYDTPAKRAGYAVTVDSSGAGKMMNGIPYDVDSLGGITAYETTSTATLLVALMVMFLVVRHTRAEEESGRAELLRATVTGRHAATAAAVLVAVVASALVGVLDTLVFLSAGFDTQASLSHGASLAGVGLVFTSVAAAAAQVTSSARAALGIAGSVVALAFVVRGVGAISDSWLRLVSPFGWAQETRPFGDAKWGWFVLLLVVAALGLLLAAYLTAHRDAGAGLLQPRPGSPRASSFLSTPFGLAFRLQRGLIIGWAVGLTLGAVLFGSLGKEVIAMVEDNPEIAEVIAVGGAGILDGFFSYSLLLLAGIATAFTVSSVLRIRAEEDAGRAESVLSTGLSRTSWVLGSLALTLRGQRAQPVPDRGRHGRRERAGGWRLVTLLDARRRQSRDAARRAADRRGRGAAPRLAAALERAGLGTVRLRAAAGLPRRPAAFPRRTLGRLPVLAPPAGPGRAVHRSPGACRPGARSGAVRRRRPRTTAPRHRLTAQPARWSGTA